MGHVVDFNPAKTEAKRLERERQEFVANGGEVQPTKEEEVAAAKKLQRQSEKESADAAAEMPVRGNLTRTSIPAAEVSKLQQREGKNTCVVFVGKLMYYKERLWAFQGSFNPPSWFLLMTADEINLSVGKFTDDDKTRFANAVARCVEIGATRLARKQYGDAAA